MYVRHSIFSRPSFEDEHRSIQLKTTLYLDSIFLSDHTFIQTVTREISNDRES